MGAEPPKASKRGADAVEAEGEDKLSYENLQTAVVLLTKLSLQHEQIKCDTARAENLTINILGSSSLALELTKNRESYDKEGKAARAAVSASDFKNPWTSNALWDAEEHAVIAERGLNGSEKEFGQLARTKEQHMQASPPSQTSSQQQQLQQQQQQQHQQQQQQ